MDDHLVHTIPNHHPTKMDNLPKTFLHVILAAIMISAAFKYVAQTAATTFAFSFMLPLSILTLVDSICEWST